MIGLFSVDSAGKRRQLMELSSNQRRGEERAVGGRDLRDNLRLLGCKRTCYHCVSWLEEKAEDEVCSVRPQIYLGRGKRKNKSRKLARHVHRKLPHSTLLVHLYPAGLFAPASPSLPKENRFPVWQTAFAKPETPLKISEPAICVSHRQFNHFPTCPPRQSHWSADAPLPSTFASESLRDSISPILHGAATSIIVSASPV